MTHLVRLGAIDIGSNSVRLLITDVIESEHNVIFKKNSLVRVPIKLGDDTFTKGIIDELKKEKLILLLQSFLGLIKVNDVQYWKTCATSAFREARNSEKVLAEIRTRTAIDIEIVNVKEECRYILLNKDIWASEKGDSYLFVDVGGGSTEIILFYQNEEVASASFKLGTIRYLSKEESVQEWYLLKEWLKIHLQYKRKILLIGSGGNINKISSLLRRCGRIKREELISFKRKLKDMTYDERLFNYNININRADVIMPAIDIYLNIMKMAKMVFIETPMIGLADGMIRDLYNKHMNGSE